MIYSNEAISPVFVFVEADVIAHNYSSGYEFTLLNSLFSTYWRGDCENLFSPEVLKRVSSSLRAMFTDLKECSDKSWKATAPLSLRLEAGND